MNELQILVLLRECRDPRPPAAVRSGSKSMRERGMRWMANPADLVALERALQLRETHGGEVTLLSIGAERVEELLRTGLAMGAGRAIRLNNRSLQGADAQAFARVLARAVEILQPDLILTGNQLEDRGFDPLLPLAAARGGMSCVQRVVSVECREGGVEILKKTDRGGRQRLEAALPVALCYAGEEELRYADLDGVMQSLNSTIEQWGMAELGLGYCAEGDNATTLVAIGALRPDPKRVITPDPSLPAFERILALLAGGVTPREGKVQQLSADATAEALLELFVEEGLLSK